MIEVPFPTHAEGSDMDFEGDVLGDGVHGTAVRTESDVYLIAIHADVEGDGRVGRWLDTLPSGIKISNLTSRRLMGMLQRRGWLETDEDGCDVWEKP